MTLAEAKLGTQRLHEMEEKKLLPEETIRELKNGGLKNFGRASVER